MAAGRADFYLYSTEKGSFSLSGRVMSPGKVFFPNFESIDFLFYLAHVRKKAFSISLSRLATDVSSPSFMKQPLLISGLLSLIVSFFFFFTSCFSVTPYHPASVTTCSISPAVPHVFSVYSLPPPLQYSPFLSFSLSLTHLSAGKIDLIKNEKDYLREIAA